MMENANRANALRYAFSNECNGTTCCDPHAAMSATVCANSCAAEHSNVGLNGLSGLCASTSASTPRGGICSQWNYEACDWSRPVYKRTKTRRADAPEWVKTVAKVLAMVIVCVGLFMLPVFNAISNANVAGVEVEVSAQQGGQTVTLPGISSNDVLYVNAQAYEDTFGSLPDAAAMIYGEEAYLPVTGGIVAANK